MNTESEYQKITLTVGRWNYNYGDTIKDISFMGRLLASRIVREGDPPYEDNYGTIWEVYQSSHNKIVVFHKDWCRLVNTTDTANIKIYEDINEVEGDIPEGLFIELKQALGIDTVEYLDI